MLAAMPAPALTIQLIDVGSPKMSAPQLAAFQAAAAEWEKTYGDPITVVVNISFGGYRGPHDGTSDWESGIDQLLTIDNRAVVVSAGNGFEAECHACGPLQPGQEEMGL